MNAIGVDVGGTKIAAGTISSEGEILSEVRHPTANAREPLLSAIAEAIADVKVGYEVGGVCLAVPGFILARENKILSAANLEAIEGIPLKEELGGRTGLQVTVENDANAAAWGEFRFGAGKDVEDLILVTLGTGVGGGVISHGVLLGVPGDRWRAGAYHRTPHRPPLRRRQPGMPRGSRLWHRHSTSCSEGSHRATGLGSGDARCGAGTAGRRRARSRAQRRRDRCEDAAGDGDLARNRPCDLREHLRP
jgi:hypothetical protein